jgi:hypothetical protein
MKVIHTTGAGNQVTRALRDVCENFKPTHLLKLKWLASSGSPPSISRALSGIVKTLEMVHRVLPASECWCEHARELLSDALTPPLVTRKRRAWPCRPPRRSKRLKLQQQKPNC